MYRLSGAKILPVVLIATVKQEGFDILQFLQSIERQTRKPDLVVVTVAPSTDNTVDQLRKFHDNTSLDFLWYHTTGNRSVGRNNAIAHAIGVLGTRDFIVACTNVSVLHPFWLEHIVAPIEAGRSDVVGGFYHIPTTTERKMAMALLTQYTQQELFKNRFVSALSMAFTVEAWQRAGGFPEDLDTSEDAAFVAALYAARMRFWFTTEASTAWRPPTLTLHGAAKTYYQFAVTDGKARLMSEQYVLTYLAYLIFPLTPLWLLFRIRKVLRAGLWKQIPYVLASAIAIDFGRMIGFARGCLSRSK